MRIRIYLNTAALLACLGLLLGAKAARADRRSFIRAYEYATQPQGNLEVELWTEIEPPPRGAFADALFTHRVELEYGLTDHWDLSLYHVFTHGGPEGSPDSAFRFDSWRSETRYRLAERGEWPVDVMLYLEGERPADLREPWELEGKVILGRDLGRVGLVANLVTEWKLASGVKAGHVFEVDLGARYEFTEAVRVGVEAWGIRTSVPDLADTTAYYAGPSLSLASARIWVQLGFGLGLNDGSEPVYLRSVIGFNL